MCQKDAIWLLLRCPQDLVGRCGAQKQGSLAPAAPTLAIPVILHTGNVFMGL